MGRLIRVVQTVLSVCIGIVSGFGQCNLNSPVVSGTTSLTCGQTTTLSATSNGTSFVWYSDSAGTNSLGIGSSYTTPPMGLDDTLYVEAVNFSSNSLTFNYTGAVQTWTVPSGVFSINFDVRGARGGNGYAQGGNGGRVTGTLPVTPGHVIRFYVGQNGQN
jgi:hypothetical protein